MDSLATDIIKIHPNKVPIIIESDLSLSKTKFVVPREITLRQFHCTLMNYFPANEKQSVIMFVNNTLPLLSDTVGQSYDLNKHEDGFLYIKTKKENTFG
jgi:GABA(A) receptor-associated protein